MSMDKSILEDFAMEATELLDDAEEALLKIDTASDINSIYNSVFRAFHSLKGSSGMIGFDDLQRHLHLLEDYLQKSKGNFAHFKSSTDYYLKGIDAARKILNGEVVQFVYEVYETKSASSHSSVNAATVRPLVLIKLKNENKSLVEKISKLKLLLGFELEVVESLETTLPKKDFAVIISDLELASLQTLIPSNKKNAPKLLLSENLFISNDVKSLYCLKAEDSEERFYYMIKLLLIEHKNSEIYSRAKGLLLYMYSDLEEYLISKNKLEIQKTLSSEIKLFIKNYMS